MYADLGPNLYNAPLTHYKDLAGKTGAFKQFGEANWRILKIIPYINRSALSPYMSWGREALRVAGER